ELNPGFDGKLLGTDGRFKNYDAPGIEGGVVTQVRLQTDAVTDISPLQAFAGLRALTIAGTDPARKGKLTDLSPLSDIKSLQALKIDTMNVADLTPLKGLQLQSLSLGNDRVADLSALTDMISLKTLACEYQPLADASPIRGLSLETLSFTGTKVTDLSPLRGSTTLKNLTMRRTPLSDPSPLVNCSNLSVLNARETQLTPARVAALQKALPKCKIEWDDPAAKQSWLAPEFQRWVADTQKLPAEKQLEAVSKKLMELNPGFDGKLMGMNAVGHPEGSPKVDKGVVTEVGLYVSQVSDLSPIRAFVGLRRISCERSGPTPCKLKSLEPLRGMALNKVICPYTEVSDLSPLEGMPLTILECGSTKISDLSALRGLPLSQLYCSNTRISDLSALKDSPLAVLIITGTDVVDLRPLEGCKQLKRLAVQRTKVTPKQVAALQKALPDCKIEWDDPAKPKTTEPATSGTK
ncbi:MAG TPA: hypothetical protein VG713_12685, partial [Pirellulales bacterium]|nr:hypothetical protein [Pirellulales bacterium]